MRINGAFLPTVPKGGKVVSNYKVNDLGQVAHDFNSDLVINCTGVWAGALTRDERQGDQMNVFKNSQKES